ncbi:hypothetical protein [Virgisporangium ochraceum]|uniref:Uncharacterized protein n=1 Tax=Virgisporangium ochraceum TaxID=65505 RepID=A0A8J4EB20_9ACTN|nr:hypothetical protein [Virgisporangium ochraceum]GIJ68920.1 hypothetical protein Voc01_038370 [Virgisporangium ochraceum]
MRFRDRRPVVSPFVNLRGVISTGIAVAAVAALIVAGPAGAADTGKRIDLRVLVVTDGSPGVDAVTAQLDREGVPYDSVDTRAAGRPTVTTALLTAATDHGRYQGVVVPNENPLPAAEATALADYERGFGVRRLVAYTWAGPHAGLTTAWSGTLDGGSLTVTAAGKAAGFGYLTGAVPVDDRDSGVPEAFASLGTAGAGFTPLVEGQAPGGGAGSVAGVYTVDGREQLVVTTALNRYLTHGLVLGHGLVTWLTKGVNLGYWRNFFSLHVDDVLLPDDRWHTGGNCTVGADCPSELTAPTIRMVPADVDALVAWQQKTGLKLDMAYNAFGSTEAGAGDPLTARLLARKGDLRWLNHTWSHPYLGCVKDETVTPWRCTAEYVPAADITTEITKNLDWARVNGVTVEKRELVTGQHSGLRSLPEMPADNPNLAPSLQAAGVTAIASDASREPAPRAVGPARTVPRHPMNIYYNTGKVAEAVDEYNWIYTSRADGGSGICESNPASTCITPLGSTGFTGHIVPTEVRIAFDHVVSADPRPHYAHQSNITEDRVLYPVLDALIARYRQIYATNTGLVNPRMLAVSQHFARQEAWRQAVASRTVTGYRKGDTVTVVNTGATVDVPLTAPTGTREAALNLLGVLVPGEAYGEAYGGQRSAWRALAKGKSATVKLPA